MNFYNINLWEYNQTKLNDYDVVGCNFRKGNMSIEEYWGIYSNNIYFLDATYHTDHFSGNFWWFNSDYIKVTVYISTNIFVCVIYGIVIEKN